MRLLPFLTITLACHAATIGTMNMHWNQEIDLADPSSNFAVWNVQGGEIDDLYIDFWNLSGDTSCDDYAYCQTTNARVDFAIDDQAALSGTTSLWQWGHEGPSAELRQGSPILIDWFSPQLLSRLGLRTTDHVTGVASFDAHNYDSGWIIDANMTLYGESGSMPMDYTATPEPSTILLLAVGLLLIVASVRRSTVA